MAEFHVGLFVPRNPAILFLSVGMGSSPLRPKERGTLTDCPIIVLGEDMTIRQSEDTLITVDEAATILKLNPETVRRYIRSGHLTASALPGGTYRLFRKDVVRLLTPVGV